MSGILCLLAWSLVFLLKNDFPDVIKGKRLEVGFIGRFKSTSIVAWLAFLGPFGYGFLESSLNAIYPVYAIRGGFELGSVSIILASFSLGESCPSCHSECCQTESGGNLSYCLGWAAVRLHFLQLAFLKVQLLQ